MASESLWHQHDTLFRRLYLDENKTLKQVKSEAEGAHGFPSNSLSTYETKLREVLGLRKNLTPEGWLAIGQRIRSNTSREWEVYICGRKIARRKVLKEIGRYAKRESSASSSRNLPMPQEAMIRWRDSSSSPSADRFVEGRYPQQRMLSTLPDSVLINSRNEGIEMTDLNLTVSVRSPSDVLNETAPLLYNQFDIIDQTIDITMLERPYTSTQVHASMFDHRLKELWEPMLNDLPLFSLTQSLDRIIHNHLASGLDADLLSNSQTAYPQISDIAHLNHSSYETKLYEASNHGDTTNVAAHTCSPPTNSTVSTGFGPLQILAQVIYHFSNHLKGLEDTEETMRFFMEKVPSSFVGQVLRGGLPAIEESWMRLAEWSFELGKTEFFEQVMEVSLSCPEWVQVNGSRCLALAANLGCSQVVRTIVECGVSPNEFSLFSLPYTQSGAAPSFSKLAAVGLGKARARVSGSTDFTVTTCPILEAAVICRRDILGIFKDTHADFQFRLDGLTTAGHAISAHRNGMMDLDDLSFTLSFLVSVEENVDAPMYLDGKKGWSEETLLDAIYLTIGGSSSLKTFEKLSQVPPGVLTVSGILQSAESGQDALRKYLTMARHPSGPRRKRIEEIALARSLQLPTAFESMMGLGFNLELKTLRGGIDLILGDSFAVKQSCSCSSSLNDHNHSILRGLDSFPAPVTQYIVDQFTEDEVLSNMGYFSIVAFIPKLSPVQIRRLGIGLLGRAMDFGDSPAVEACLEAGVNPQEIDLLNLAGSGRLNRSVSRVLHDHGAQLDPYSQGLKFMSLDKFSTKMLRWLMAHLSDIKGKKTCDIVTDFLVNEVDWKYPTAFQQWLACSDHNELFGYPHCHDCDFNSEEAESYKDSNSACLALLICLGSSLSLIRKLLHEGVDLNSRQVVTPSKKNSKPDKKDNSKNKTKQHHKVLNAQKYQSDLETAIKHYNVPRVQELLSDRADINHCDVNGQTVLEFAVRSYLTDYRKDFNSWQTIAGKQLVVMLLEHGADPNFEYHKAFKKTVSPSLVCAVESSQVDLHLIQLLLEKGACPDTEHDYSSSRNRPGKLIRHVFADKGKDLQLKKKIFALLLASGAEYNKANELYISCISGDIELVRFHLQNGAEPNVLDTTSYASPPLPYENPDRLDLDPWLDPFEFQFPSFDIDIHSSCLCVCEGRDLPFAHPQSRPLEVSAAEGNIPLALILLAAGAVLSGQDHSLSVAAANGRLDMVSLLLRHEKRLEEVERALELAENGRFYSIVQLLRRAKTNLEA